MEKEVFIFSFMPPGIHPNFVEDSSVVKKFQVRPEKISKKTRNKKNKKTSQALDIGTCVGFKDHFFLYAYISRKLEAVNR